MPEQTHPTDGGRHRCGKGKRHNPHWWGEWHNIWCDGRWFPLIDGGQQMIEPPGKEV